MTDRPSRSLLALAAAAVLLTAGCGGGSGGPAAAPTAPIASSTTAAAALPAGATGDPAAIRLLARYGDARPQRMSATMVMSFSGATAAEAGLADLRTTMRMDGEVDGGRMRMQMEADVPPGAPALVPLEMRIDGDRAWVGLGETWFAVDPASAQQLVGSGPGLQASFLGALRDVALAGTTEVDGVALQRVRATVDGSLYRGTSAALAQVPGANAAPPAAADAIAEHALAGTFEALVDADGFIRETRLRSGIDFAGTLEASAPGTLPPDAELEMWTEGTSRFTPLDAAVSIEEPVGARTDLTLAEIMAKWQAGVLSA